MNTETLYGTQWGEEIARLKAERDAAQKACAEMRELLSVKYPGRDGYPPGPIIWNNWHIAAEHALSSDCGKGYIPVKELEPTIALLRELHEDTDPEYAPTTERELAKEIDRLEHLLKGAQ